MVACMAVVASAHTSMCPGRGLGCTAAETLRETDTPHRTRPRRNRHHSECFSPYSTCSAQDSAAECVRKTKLCESVSRGQRGWLGIQKPPGEPICHSGTLSCHRVTTGAPVPLGGPTASSRNSALIPFLPYPRVLPNDLSFRLALRAVSLCGLNRRSRCVNHCPALIAPEDRFQHGRAH